MKDEDVLAQQIVSFLPGGGAREKPTAMPTCTFLPDSTSAPSPVPMLTPSPALSPTPMEARPSHGPSLRCSEPVKAGPAGEVVVFDVELANTGTVEATFDLFISPSLPDGWQGTFCIGDECYYGGIHSVTVLAGGTQLVEIKIRATGDASSGQAGGVTLLAVSQGDAARSDSVDVTLIVE